MHIYTHTHFSMEGDLLLKTAIGTDASCLYFLFSRKVSVEKRVH